eukprot:m.160474 g.160474  ORF g.160474 m.160474 type:complete len:489 (-) comp24825_c2_seq1:79-1545(-)
MNNNEQAIGDNDECFLFIKWHGGDGVTSEMLSLIFKPVGGAKSINMVRGKRLAYAEFETSGITQRACRCLNGQQLEEIKFQTCLMPSQPVVVPVGPDPLQTKFYADLNKAIKARNHQRLVQRQAKEKLIREQQRKLEAEKNAEAADKAGPKLKEERAKRIFEFLDEFPELSDMVADKKKVVAKPLQSLPPPSEMTEPPSKETNVQQQRPRTNQPPLQQPIPRPTEDHPPAYEETVSPSETREETVSRETSAEYSPTAKAVPPSQPPLNDEPLTTLLSEEPKTADTPTSTSASPLSSPKQPAATKPQQPAMNAKPLQTSADQLVLAFLDNQALTTELLEELELPSESESESSLHLSAYSKRCRAAKDEFHLVFPDESLAVAVRELGELVLQLTLQNVPCPSVLELPHQTPEAPVLARSATAIVDRAKLNKLLQKEWKLPTKPKVSVLAGPLENTFYLHFPDAANARACRKHSKKTLPVRVLLQEDAPQE